MSDDEPQGSHRDPTQGFDLTSGLSTAITSLADAICGLAREVSLHKQPGGLESRLNQLNERLNSLMANQQELAADLRVVLEQQKKTQAEIQAIQAATDVLKEKVKELEDIIASNPEAAAIPELVQAVADVKAQAQVVDDEIPDPADAKPAGSKPRPVP